MAFPQFFMSHEDYKEEITEEFTKTWDSETMHWSGMISFRVQIGRDMMNKMPKIVLDELNKERLLRFDEDTVAWEKVWKTGHLDPNSPLSQEQMEM